mmetsp:Transcript_29318/g.38548  ORF Transcript_29318/g.38548 Transcript_29318/m.38548 type:complete len:481 (+) Transcript_29318:196-1638(+)
MMRSIAVVYEIYGEINGSEDGLNGFNFMKPESEEVLFLDLLSNFPETLGESWHWSVFHQHLDCWLDYRNPASVIPCNGNLVRARLLQLAEAPRVAKQAVLEQSKREISVISSAAFPASDQSPRSLSPPRKAAPSTTPELATSNVENEEKDGATHGQAAMKMFGAGLRAVRKAGEAIASNVILKEATVGRTKVRVGREIAEGGFSKVYLARSLDGRQTYALKQMICHERDAILDARKELELLRKINHRNVIQVVDAGMSDYKPSPGAKDIMLLFPFYVRGTIWDLMVNAQDSQRPWPFNELYSLQMFLGTCQGVAEMHQLGFIHRDLKPLNILIADDGSPVLMDVGSATRTGRRVTNRSEALLMEEEAAAKCSAPYRPPELTQVEVGVTLDGAVDVWSLGCTLYCMAFGHSPFETPREGVMKLGIINARFSFPPGNQHKGISFSNAFCQFISSMLKANPRKRPNIKAVIEQTSLLIKGISH